MAPVPPELDLAIIPVYELSVTFFLSLACIVTLFVPHNICYLIPALTTYGKTAGDVQEQPALIRILSVPKSWFTHFYLWGILNTVFWLQLLAAIQYHILFINPSHVYYLSFLTNLRAAKLLNFSTGVLALSLVLFHLLRRSYETLFVCIYSDSRMNIFHYFVGIIHYTILPLVIVCEMRGVVSKTVTDPSFLLTEISLQQWFGAVLFLYCNYQQNKLATVIANTRRGPRGLVRNYAHGICFGGWFNYVSCPHFLFEILIYLSLWIVLEDSYGYKYVVVFVFVNQFFAAQITHRWYQKTFSNYPPQRKALVPYVC